MTASPGGSDTERYVMSTTSSGGGDRVGVGRRTGCRRNIPNGSVHVTPMTTAFAVDERRRPASRELLAPARRRTSTWRRSRSRTCRSGRDQSPASTAASCGASASPASSATSSTSPRRTACTCGRRASRPAATSASALRRRGAADHAAGEGALHRRPGHRRAHAGVRRRPRCDWSSSTRPTSRASPSWLGSEQRDDYQRLVALATRRSGRVCPRKRARSSSETWNERASSAGSRRAGCRRRWSGRSASASWRRTCASLAPSSRCTYPTAPTSPARVMEHHAHVDPDGTRLRA